MKPHTLIQFSLKNVMFLDFVFVGYNSQLIHFLFLSLLTFVFNPMVHVYI